VKFISILDVFFDDKYIVKNKTWNFKILFSKLILCEKKPLNFAGTVDAYRWGSGVWLKHLIIKI
jgi:hypothetical protein